MHVPNPLGGYPLVLRESSTSDYRNGELLLDYTNNKIYYVGRRTGIPIDIAKSIYDKLIKAKLENSQIIPVKESDSIPVEEPTIPVPLNRKFNAWYMNIYKKTDISE